MAFHQTPRFHAKFTLEGTFFITAVRFVFLNFHIFVWFYAILSTFVALNTLFKLCVRIKAVINHCIDIFYRLFSNLSSITEIRTSPPPRAWSVFVRGFRINFSARWEGGDCTLHLYQYHILFDL